MRAIYIILVGLPCWARLSRWIPLRVALPNSWWWISFTDLGLSVNCNGVRPSAKFSGWGSAIGQTPVAFGHLSWVFNGLGLSAKSTKGLGPSVFRPSPQGVSAFGHSDRLTGHRAARWVPVSPGTGTVLTWTVYRKIKVNP